MLSLICSCFYSQPHPNTIYQYGGECALGSCPASACSTLPCSPSHGLSTPLWLGWLLDRGSGGSGLGVPREQPHLLLKPFRVCTGNMLL